LGSPLQSGGKTFWSRQDGGRVVKVLLLAETSTGCQQIYKIVHYLCHRQTSHQEVGTVHTPTDP
jgi:hypothetical protein